MNVLFVTHHWPAPLARFTQGTGARMRLLLRGLQAAGHEISILTYCPSDVCFDNPSEAAELRDSFWNEWRVKVSKVFIAPGKPPVRSGGFARTYLAPMFNVNAISHFGRVAGADQVAALRAAIEESGAEMIFAQSLMVMSTLRRAGGSLPPVLLNLDDIEHVVFARSIPMPPTWRLKKVQWAWLPAMKYAERRALEIARLAFVCSEPERRYLLHKWGASRVAVLPNAIPIPKSSPVPADLNVLFVGLQSYDPNRVGAEFLIERVWPLVLAQHPAARLLIAGRGAEGNRFFGASPPSVEFLGFVENLSALYARSRVVVCPILSGGGTRIKLVEGALQQRPIVSTTVGAEGLDLDPDQGEISLHDSAEGFARAVIEFLSDFHACETMGRRARERAERLYGEPAAIRQFVSALEGALITR